MYKRVIVGLGFLFGLAACSAAQSPSGPAPEMGPGMERGRKKHNSPTFAPGCCSPA